MLYVAAFLISKILDLSLVINIIYFKNKFHLCLALEIYNHN